MTPGRVLVVGGGIAGLSAAIALRKVGFTADVFERAPALREVGAGVGLWSSAMASLDELGVGDALRAASLPLRVVAGLNPAGATISSFDLDAFGPDFASAVCRVVPRRALLAALAERLPKEAIHTGRHVTAAEVDGDRARLVLEGGGTEAGVLVVGADGLHSVVRPLVVGADRTRYSGQTCFRGLARIAPPRPEAMIEVQGRGQRGSVCPITDESVYWWVAHNAPEGVVVPPEERKAMLVEKYRGWPLGIADAIAATPYEEILHNDLVDRPPARKYVSGLLALVGDAAHPTTPNLGQGANMAIDDAIVFARALHAEASVAAGLARYERERLPRTRLVVQRSWSFGRMCRWDSAMGVGLRELMVRLTPTGVMRDMLRWQVLEGVGPL